jgi:tetratricopeptide (TPR) repeat protein
MTGGTDEIWQAIERADAMPYGRARIALLEELIERIKGSDWEPDVAAELDTAVRVSLIPACLYGGDHQRVSGLLSVLLEQYDQAPAWFGPWERHGVLFCFNWATVGLLQHPDVPLAQLEQLLTTMAERFAAAGESMAPVLRARFLFTLHVHGPVAATEAFDAWLAAGRSELSECEECERAEQVRQFAALDRHLEAVELALPVLDGGPVAGCATQPISMIGAVLGSLLKTGLAERAAGEHIRAVRLIRMLPTGTAPGQLGRADHLLVCARSGRLQRGLDLLEEWLPWYATVGPPTSRLETAAAAGRMLRGLAESGHGQLVLTTDGTGADPMTGDELGARLAHEARDLGSRFDARNGTSTIGDLVEAVLDASALPDLPLDALTRSQRFARVRPAPARSGRGRRAVGRSTESVPSSESPTALATAFTEALQADAGDRGEAILKVWRRLRDRPGVTGARATPTGAGRPIWTGGPSASGGPSVAVEEKSAAQLDGWLALAELSRPGLDVLAAQAALAGSALATERLRMAGLPIAALLHEQAALLAAAQVGRMDLGVALHRVEQLAAEVGESANRAEEGATGSGASAGDVGLALSRLVLIRELAALHGYNPDDAAASGPNNTAASGPNNTASGPNNPAGTGPDNPAELPPDTEQPLPEGDPLDAGLAALGSAPADQLDHQQLRAVARLLRVRARDEPEAEAIETLRAAVAVLPDGVRPLERAQAGADLASALQDVDPVAALVVWDQAVEDAGLASAAPALGSMLAASATLRAALGNPERAAEDLARAVPLLDEHTHGPLAAQARLDLSRALLELGRGFEAAEVAEAGMADLTELLRGQGVGPDDLDGGDGSDAIAPGDADPSSGVRAEVHVAGCLAYVAAEANEAVGALDRARGLALRSADWHRINHNLVAQAEAWELAARLGGPPARVAHDFGRAAELADAGGDWVRAATCRRERIIALKDAEGVEAALAALAEADAALGARVTSPAGRHAPEAEQQAAGRQLRWHRLAVAEQRARILAVSGRFREAMQDVQGLERQYHELGDPWSARDLLGLRGQLRAELDDLDGALEDLRRAAEEAEEAGDSAQAQGLGERLATVLGEAGRETEAEAAWRRFCEV